MPAGICIPSCLSENGLKYKERETSKITETGHGHKVNAPGLNCTCTMAPPAAGLLGIEKASLDSSALSAHTAVGLNVP